MALRLSKSSSRFIPNPKPTTLKDLVGKVSVCPNCTEVKMRDWNLSITTYRKEDDVISRILARNGTWEPEAVTHACNEYRIHSSKGNMLDVGGNIGAFGLPLADCLRTYSKDNGRVIAVEATKHNSEKYRASIKRNNLDNVHLYEYAISSPDANDTVVMCEHNKNHGHTVVVDKKTNDPVTSEYEVPVTTLDSILKAEGDAMKRIFFLKIDIDGHEVKALNGAKEFMENYAPCIVFAEFFNGYTKEYLETGEDPIAKIDKDKKDKKLLEDATRSNAMSTVKSMLQKWGYVQYLSGRGTGGPEGWFKHKNWKGCIKRVDQLN